MTGPRTTVAWLSVAGVAIIALTSAGLYYESRDRMPWYFGVAPQHLPRFIAAVLAQGIIYLGAVRFVLRRGRESIVWMKAAMVAFEALAVWLLIRLLIGLRLSAEHVIIYAWNPLALWEFAGSGHGDAAVVAFIGLTPRARHRGRPF